MANNLSPASLIQSFSWDQAFAHYDWDPRSRFNAAHEVCDRYAEDPNRIALFYENALGEQKRSPIGNCAIGRTKWRTCSASWA